MVKINPNQYLGSQELNKAFSSIRENGYQKIFGAFVREYGVVLSNNDTSLAVTQGTAGARWLNVKAGIAIDDELNIIDIPTDLQNIIEFPNTNTSMFLVIKYKKTSFEKGTISIASDGSISGTGTEFKKVLRGGVNQNKIRIESNQNLNDYNVLEVIDDTTAILNFNTALTAETGKRFSIVGTFTPGATIPESSKLIYENDSYELLLTNTGITTNKVFKLAKITFANGALSIQDWRDQQKLKLYDTTEELVATITATVVSQYNSNVTSQISSQFAAIATTLQTLAGVDSALQQQINQLIQGLTQKAGIAQEDWQFFTLPSSVSNTFTGNERSKYKKNTVQTVFVQADLTANSTIAYNATLLTLPELYRPSMNMILPAVFWDGTGVNQASFIKVNLDGTIVFLGDAAITINQKIQFNFNFSL